MSRARLICSDILSRLSPITSIEEKAVLCSQDIDNIVNEKNLNLFNEETIKIEDKNKTEIINKQIGQIYEDSQTVVSMDEWLKDRNITIESISTSGFSIDADQFLNPKDNDMCEISELELVENEQKTSDKDNLILDHVDPLLNVDSLKTKTFRHKKCDLGFNSDCDINMIKNRINMWDTLSVASRKSDGETENTDFTDFNLLSYTFDPTDMGMLETSTDSTEDIVFELKTEDTLSIPIEIKKSRNPNKSKLIRESDDDPVLAISSTKVDRNMNVGDEDISLYNRKTINDEYSIVENNFKSSNLTDILKNKITQKKGNTQIDNVIKPQKIIEVGNITGAVAIVSNSTVNKAKPKTKIVIKTDKGEEKYEGNTADLIPPFSNKKKDKSATAPVLGKHIITSVKTAATIKDASLKSTRFRHEQDDSLIKDMLAVLNITDDKLYTVVTNLGLRVWVCPIHDCRRIFNRLQALKTHILSHFGLKPFKCDYPECPWSFYTSFKLKRHRETHLKKKNFICTVPDCNRTFTTVYNLNTHLKLHDRPYRLNCPVNDCNFRFQTIRSMEKHLKTHEESSAPYRCKHPGCEKFYFSFSSLNAHSRCHQHKREELTCQYCEKVFDKPCRLKAHMRQHTGDKPYVCTYQDCKWAFSSSSKLKRHQHKHIGERRFRCTIDNCNKAFMRSEHLKDHTLTHIGTRTFPCPFCGDKFGAKASLYVHKRKFHSNEVMKNNNNKNNSSSPLTSIVQKILEDPVDSTLVNELSLKIDRQSSKVIVCHNPNDMAPPPSPATYPQISLQSFPSDDFEINSLFKQEFSNLEVVEPILLNEIETQLETKENKSKNKKNKKSKKETSFNNEGCVRTSMTYFMYVDQKNKPEKIINNIIEDDSVGVSPKPLVCETDSILTQESIIEPTSNLTENLVLQTEVNDADLTAGDVAYTCSVTDGLSLTDAPSEMIINADLLQDDQQPIFLSNLVLQDESTSELFTTETDGSNEYILLLNPPNTFSESTINLRDLD